MRNESTRTGAELNEILKAALAYVADPEFQVQTQQVLGYDEMCYGPKRCTWAEYLWKAAYSAARYERSDAGAQAIAQSEADSAWFGHDGISANDYQNHQLDADANYWR